MEYATSGGGSSFAQFRLKRTEDVHIHAQQLQSWEQEYEQVSRGPFHGEVVAPEKFTPRPAASLARGW